MDRASSALGKRNWRTLVIKHHYGVALLEAGRAQDAVNVLREVVDDRKQVAFRPDFERKLNSVLELARAERALRDIPSVAELISRLAEPATAASEEEALLLLGTLSDSLQGKRSFFLAHSGRAASDTATPPARHAKSQNGTGGGQAVRGGVEICGRVRDLVGRQVCGSLCVVGFQCR